MKKNRAELVAHAILSFSMSHGLEIAHAISLKTKF